MSRLKDIRKSVTETREVKPGKTTDLEKGDFWALCKAAYSVFGKALLLVILFFAAVILIITFLWQ